MYNDCIANNKKFFYNTLVNYLLFFDAVFLFLGYFLVILGYFGFADCAMVTGNRVLFLSVALHMNWVALADIHFMLPGGHGHERGSTISQWDMGWEVKDSGWLLGSSGIVHEDRLGMIRFVRLKLQYIDRDIV